jgi:hypothetical protein
MQASQHNMHDVTTGFGGWFITVSLLIFSHVITVTNLQGLAAFTAVIYGGLNIFFLIKKNSKK